MNKVIQGFQRFCKIKKKNLHAPKASGINKIKKNLSTKNSSHLSFPLDPLIQLITHKKLYRIYLQQIILQSEKIPRIVLLISC